MLRRLTCLARFVTQEQKNIKWSFEVAQINNRNSGLNLNIATLGLNNFLVSLQGNGRKKHEIQSGWMALKMKDSQGSSGG